MGAATGLAGEEDAGHCKGAAVCQRSEHIAMSWSYGVSLIR